MNEQVGARNVGNFSITQKAEAFVRSMVRFGRRPTERPCVLAMLPVAALGSRP